MTYSLKSIKDYKKAKIIEMILFRRDLNVLLKLTPNILELKRWKKHPNLNTKKLYELFSLDTSDVAHIKTKMGVLDNIYIPIPKPS